MRVVVAYEAGKPLVLEDLPVPAVGPRDVLVRVSAGGICHTDLNVIDGLSALPLPIGPGHEGCGVVEEVGAEVRTLRPGQRVIAPYTFSDGTCGHCREGFPTFCLAGGFFGGHQDGAIGMRDVHIRNVRLTGGRAPVRNYIPELMDDVLAGRLDPSPVVDLVVPLKEVAAGYTAMDERRATTALVVAGAGSAFRGGNKGRSR